MCLIFALFLAHSSLNPWNFPSAESDGGVFCYVNEVTLLGSTKARGLVARRTHHVISGLELSVPSTSHSGQRKGAGG